MDIDPIRRIADRDPERSDTTKHASSAPVDTVALKNRMVDNRIQTNGLKESIEGHLGPDTNDQPEYVRKTMGQIVQKGKQYAAEKDTLTMARNKQIPAKP